MNAKNIDSQSESTRLYRAWQNANIIIIIGVLYNFLSWCEQAFTHPQVILSVVVKTIIKRLSNLTAPVLIHIHYFETSDRYILTKSHGWVAKWWQNCTFFVNNLKPVTRSRAHDPFKCKWRTFCPLEDELPFFSILYVHLLYLFSPSFSRDNKVKRSSHRESVWPEHFHGDHR